MSGFLTRIGARTLGLAPVAKARPLARFEQERGDAFAPPIPDDAETPAPAPAREDGPRQAPVARETGSPSTLSERPRAATAEPTPSVGRTVPPPVSQIPHTSPAPTLARRRQVPETAANPAETIAEVTPSRRSPLPQDGPTEPAARAIPIAPAPAQGRTDGTASHTPASHPKLRQPLAPSDHSRETAEPAAILNIKPKGNQPPAMMAQSVPSPHPRRTDARAATTRSEPPAPAPEARTRRGEALTVERRSPVPAHPAPPALSRPAPQPRTEGPATPQPVEVVIGRIDVRLPPAPEPKRAPMPAAGLRHVPSLGDYLARRR